ncbi:MAG: hypothetical protein R3F21_18550 [Myxococcota bacterium]
MERYLDEKGSLETFHLAFERAAGRPVAWTARCGSLHRDEVVAALKEASGKRNLRREKWVDGAEANFSLTVENFAKWVKRYLDNKGPNNRIEQLPSTRSDSSSVTTPT